MLPEFILACTIFCKNVKCAWRISEEFILLRDQVHIPGSVWSRGSHKLCDGRAGIFFHSINLKFLLCRESVGEFGFLKLGKGSFLSILGRAKAIRQSLFLHQSTKLLVRSILLEVGAIIFLFNQAGRF